MIEIYYYHYHRHDATAIYYNDVVHFKYKQPLTVTMSFFFPVITIPSSPSSRETELSNRTPYAVQVQLVFGYLSNIIFRHTQTRKDLSTTATTTKNPSPFFLLVYFRIVVSFLGMAYIIY